MKIIKRPSKFSGAFHDAVRTYDVTKLKSLLSANFDVNAKDDSYSELGELTALQYWVVFNIPNFKDSTDIEFCEVLLLAGADSEQIDSINLDTINFNRNKRAMRKIEDRLVGSGLRELKIHDRSAEKLGYLLHRSIGENTLSIAEKYLQAGASPSFVDITSSDGLLSYPSQHDLDGYTPMDKALYDSNADLLMLLLEYDADPNSLGANRHYTPLQTSLRISSISCTEILILVGAQVGSDDFNYVRNKQAYNLIQLAYAMQRYPNDPIKQVAAVLKQSLIGESVRSYFNFWSSNPMDELIKKIHNLTTFQLDDLELLNTIEFLIKDVSAVKYNFINNYILIPARAELQEKEGATLDGSPELIIVP